EPGRAACRVFSCAHLSKGSAYKAALNYACRRYTGNSHAILEIKMTAGYFGITCTPPVSLCFSPDPSLFVRLLFSSRVRILWARLAHPCPFFLLFTGKQDSGGKMGRLGSALESWLNMPLGSFSKERCCFRHLSLPKQPQRSGRPTASKAGTQAIIS